ncbi:MAG: NAD-dependent epimerase/dehydratase family protein, partial [Betaproteobacteria bacterium]|nr:NAD-dependent epimerase/dehydratase family protein [Betaproteobacteria bacterium]
MKILITGGAGFIGSHLVEKLLIKNNEILIIDNLMTGKKENLSFEGNYELFIDDLGSKKSLNKIIEFNPDVCFHLAAQASVVISVSNPALDFDHNILQPILLLKTLLKTDCKKFVFSSSGGTIFGEPVNVPTSEEDFAGEPQSPYGVAKKRLNELIQIITKDTNMSYSILNFSNVFGPRQDPHGEAGVISIFSNKFLSNEQPIIYGDGNQTRDYVYVMDVVEAMILSSKTEENLFLNIGTGIETSVNQLVEIMKDKFNSDIEPIYQDAREGELLRSVLDNSKALASIGWKPVYDLNIG